MLFSEEELDEFVALCAEEDGKRPSRAEARETATRLVLLYRLLALPAPEERVVPPLANSDGRGTLSDGVTEPRELGSPDPDGIRPL